MTSKFQQTILAGMAGTAMMTLVTLMAPMMGIPKMSPPAMLSMMMGFPILIGWLMHFMIGITFGAAYVFYFIPLVKKISNYYLKGALFGMAVFIFAQIMLAVLGMIFPMPAMEGSMFLMMLGSLLGHIIYGITVAMVVK